MSIQMLIRYPSGEVLEGVMLSIQGAIMRVAIKGSDDVTEYQLLNGAWVSEDCEPVTFDFSLSILAAVGIVPPGDDPSATAAESPISLAAVISPLFVN
jgi:hypothetical protein